jgi:L-ascorbate metabolism protein UlaG (beta-lactamase superfamily)
MRALAKSLVPIITSLGVGARLESMGIACNRITELDWWESHTVPGSELTFTATPSQHFSGRTLNDRNRTLWSSFVVRTKRHQHFFSGDTGLTQEFLDIQKKFGNFDLIMLEIGAWNTAWGDIHLGPHNALQAFEMLGGGTLLPVHWGTFDLALHRWDEPAETLYCLAQTKGARLLTPVIGDCFEPKQIERPNPWWRAIKK